MRITKSVARIDPATGEIVLEGLEMENVHDGVLRLTPEFLSSLLALTGRNTPDLQRAYDDLLVKYEELKAAHEALHNPDFESIKDPYWHD
jgi:hypothetical protein